MTNLSLECVTLSQNEQVNCGLTRTLYIYFLQVFKYGCIDETPKSGVQTSVVIGTEKLLPATDKIIEENGIRPKSNIKS